MPARYPPIAPRGPATPERRADSPLRIEHINNLDALPSEEGYGAQLAALAADKRRFLAAHHPIRDALNMALQQPAGALLARYAATHKAMKEAHDAPMPSDEPGERSPDAVALDTRPAIVAYTESMVAMAILGNLSAAALVSDRIEGKAGLRKADLDAETAAQRERVRDTVGLLVEAMVERRTSQRGDDATVIDGEVTTTDDV